IWSREIVTNGVSLEGASLSVTQSAQGEYSVRELDTLGLTSQKEATSFNDVMNWLSQISNLAIHNIDLNVTRYQHKTENLTLSNLRFENDGDSHQIEGDAILHQTLPTEVTMRAEWQGNQFDLHKLNSKIYLYLSGLNLSQWLHDRSWQDWQVAKGIASSRVWLESANCNIQQVQSQ